MGADTAVLTTNLRAINDNDLHFLDVKVQCPNNRVLQNTPKGLANWRILPQA